MSLEFRRVVTRLDENGKAVCAEDAPIVPIISAAMPGVGFYKVWGVDDEQSAPVRELAPVHDPFFPPRHGNRFIIVVFPPDSEKHEITMSSEEIQAEAEAVSPGLLGVFEPDNPGFHRTVSIDYDFVLEGELYLELDGGKEVRLPAGTSIVMNGTRHAWRNKSDKPAKLLAVVLGAKGADEGAP